MASRLASISVDLDSLHHYCRIHGLPETVLDARARGLVYAKAVPRFRELWGALGVPGTFFAIGEDLADAGAAEALRQAQAAGVEIANHSFSHDYALSRRAPESIHEDLARGEQAILAATGTRPVGFRAPGYTLNAALYAATAARGYRYGSSAFPAAPYYAAKATVMGALALAGRPSRSVLDSPRVLLAPREPYRPDPRQPYRRGTGTVVELPMTVTPGARFPFIGTFAATLPMSFIRAAYLACRGSALFNFELHAVDVLDATDGIPAELVRQQRDLQVPAARKMERLATLFRWLKADADTVTLREAAERLAPGL
ncbi:polysaccharide deacetylase family protein [Stigmatella aurantiaca]|uniref:Polysaccharide deacetylase domain protein n=1 Tax=Stigmatella aurantiaca (strain DW4/3-1) TaxID=378806 RepID=Q08SV3_STIAD|nr:polysaccharide deacetylase family protein [Stigmatella aurantiaca]ADO70510.1 Polysaccharide deacetylase domain protein [Stigmatella aurantiaca DW4/3-1]EAU63552.1 polysaccharide deacetylase domain protein [Stigmatella aurantiaca DW4/3-1]